MIIVKQLTFDEFYIAQMQVNVRLHGYIQNLEQYVGEQYLNKQLCQYNFYCLLFHHYGIFQLDCLIIKNYQITNHLFQAGSILKMETS